MLVGHCPLTGVPTHEKAPEAGSYRSAVAIAAPDCPESLSPPAISTCPAFGPVVRRLAVCRCRSVFIGALVAAKVGELPSVRISAVTLYFAPPATRTILSFGFVLI